MTKSFQCQKNPICKLSNLEKCAENAIHFHANQLQPIPAMVAAGTYPEQRILKLLGPNYIAGKRVGRDYSVSPKEATN